MIFLKTMKLPYNFKVTIALFVIVFVASLLCPVFSENEDTINPYETEFMSKVTTMLNAGYGTGMKRKLDIYYGILSGLSSIMDEGDPDSVFVTARDIYFIIAIGRIIGEDELEDAINKDEMFTDIFINKKAELKDLLNELNSVFPDSKEKLEKTFDAFSKAEDIPKYSLLGAVLHQDDDKKPRFSITGELHREGPQCDIYNIPYRIILKDGEVFDGTFNMPGKIASFEIGLATQPVSIEIDPDFEMFRYIPEEDRSEEEVLNSSLTETFSFIVVCDKGACFTVDIE